MSLARIRTAARLLAVAALAALTAGCFQPMYAERTDGTPGLREKLMGVEIPPVDKANASRDARIGVEIRNALAFKLYGNATGMPPTHRLVLRFNSNRSSLMIDPATALPSSENYGIDAQYNLIEIASNKSVMTGSTFSRVSYDIPGSIQRFARARAFRDAEDRAAQEIAENIQTRLASFFVAGTGQPHVGHRTSS
jgi:LPS-assembly lipoprotein